MQDRLYSIVDSDEQQAGGGEVVVPIVEEQVEVKKRLVEREHVRLTKSTTTRDEVVDVPLLQEEITVERVPIGRVVEAAAAPSSSERSHCAGTHQGEPGGLDSGRTADPAWRVQSEALVLP